ncbi:VOC family protein [Dyadobacter fanqingshengii]|uniref:VOC family protein n=1 Tax=Dyadobacter fanqingshengii TaxID=2906443 RepID=A0A9X1TAB4_9BACT|nr:VOC family protein [Dyadobacter fanqingshengii]MCF0040789.1 VOC family protein [Dyadobacter fanqingshengii]USJ37476.1 VOC family protein [Dyadobacter fanqingshengii]
MATKVFINLPVNDLVKSRAFFTKLGYSVNEQFSDENAACLVISDSIFCMLLTNDYFKTFTNKPVADATKTTEVLIALDAASREEVIDLVAKAEDAGASIYREAQDHGWMYQHSFADLDGHQWEIIYMDESQTPE